MVDNPFEITFADLLARPQVERYVTLSCVSNPVGGGYIGNALWQGVLLKDVLDEAGVQAGATQVVSRSVDGWTAGTPTEVIMDGRDAMLAIAMNGEPLPARNGYPVRMVVPGLYGYVSATKWVTEIELTRWEDYDAYWVPRGWSKEGPIKTMARIDSPRQRDHVGEVVVGGVAWAIHRGVSKVQVRVDDGDWADAELGGVPSNDTWVQWMLRIAPSPGKHVIEARAFDGDGVPQTDGVRPRRPQRSAGLSAAHDQHQVRLNPTRNGQRVSPKWSEGVGLGVEGGDQFVERLLEARHALSFELGCHVVHVDADSGERIPDLAGRLDVGVDAAGDRAVVAEGLQRVVGQGVHRVRADQLVDVERVGVRRVLGRRRRPQRPLHAGAACSERLPAGPGERLDEELVGELALGDGRLAPQRERLVGADRVEAPVDLGVDPADEEAGDARDPRQVGGGVGGKPLQATRGRPPSPSSSDRG